MKLSNFLSYRSKIWQNTSRGGLPEIFLEDMDFEKYVDMSLNMPLLFILQNAKHIKSEGKTFKDFIKGDVKAIKNNKPTLKDIDTFMESRKNWLSRYFLFGICGYYNKQLRCGFAPKGNFTMTPNLNEVYVKEMKKIIIVLFINSLRHNGHVLFLSNHNFIHKSQNLWPHLVNFIIFISSS